MPQQEDSNVKALRLWLRGCPSLSTRNPFRVDFLDDDRTEYALQHTPSTIRYRENVLGQFEPASEQQQNFSLLLRLPYGQDASQNMVNAAFCQQVCEWMIAENAARRLPKIKEGVVVSVVPTLSQYISQAGAESAIYQIQIQINYKRL